MQFVFGIVLGGIAFWAIVLWWKVLGFLMRSLIPLLLVFPGLLVIIAGARRGEAKRAHAPLPRPEPDDELVDPTASDVFGGEPAVSPRAS